MDFQLLLKSIGYFPDHLSALSRTLLRFFWTTFVETTVYANDRLCWTTSVKTAVNSDKILVNTSISLILALICDNLDREQTQLSLKANVKI